MTRGCPLSAVRLTYWLFSRVNVKGLGFVVNLRESCFPCLEERYAFILEQRWWDAGNTNSRVFWKNFVQDHPVVRCDIRTSLSEVPL